jgi:hypothetical protein
MPAFALAIAGLAFGSPELGTSLAEFSRSVDLRHTLERVEVGRLGGPGQAHYWLRRTMREAGVETVSWADTRTCPAARGVLDGMRDISVHAAPPGSDEPLRIVLHGIHYMLRAPARSGAQHGEITVRSNVDTPLSRWGAASFSALRPCWTDDPPGPPAR